MKQQYNKDSKGRRLLDGEYQRKDGTYQYRYTGSDGKRHYIYSCRLTSADPTPPRKKKQLPLRELEKKVQQDLSDGISADNYTFGKLYEKFMTMKIEIRQTTRECYESLYDRYIKDRFENVQIDKIKYSDLKNYYVSLIEDNKLSGGTVKKIDCLISQCFSLAVFDDLLRKNPCDGIIKELRKSKHFDPKKVMALTNEQQSELIEFVKNSEQYKCWMPLITFLLGTGCRIGEAAGLYWENVDFDNNVVHINHSLTTVSGIHRITEPKTKNSIRSVDMLADVKQMLYRLKIDRGAVNPKDYVFVNQHGHFIDRNYFNATLKRICKAYNEEHKNNFLPENISPHVFRHTTCTRMYENGVNIKVIQSILGHADISTTMDIYTDVFEDQKAEAIKSLEGKMKVV